MKKEKAKKVLIENNIESITGEIMTQDITKTIAVGKEPDFYKVYIEDLAKLQGLNPTENQVIQILAKNMSFKNIVILVKEIKELISEETGKSYETIKKAIEGLVNKKILLKAGRAIYKVNPKYIAKGKWEDIRALRMTIDYTEKGKQLRIESISQYEITYREPIGHSIDISTESEIL